MRILYRYHGRLIFARVVALFMFVWPYVRSHILCMQLVICLLSHFIIPPLIEWGLYCNHLVRPSVCPSIRSHFHNRYLSFYWKKWFYIWYMALAWRLVLCLPFPGLPHIYFLFTVRHIIFHVCCNENFRNSYLSFYWKKWFYIWYMALAWWLVPCLPFPGLLHIYFLFTVRHIIFHVCCNENFRNSYPSFYWKKWFYIWYMALAWWLVQCLPFPGLPHIYFLFTVRLNKWTSGGILSTM
jgi:hypothetical protein